MDRRRRCTSWRCWPLPLLGGASLRAPHARPRPAACVQGQATGLGDWQGWLGFGLSVCCMLCTVACFVSLQAFRHLGFTSLQLQVGLAASLLPTAPPPRRRSSLSASVRSLLL